MQEWAGRVPEAWGPPCHFCKLRPCKRLQRCNSRYSGFSLGMEVAVSSAVVRTGGHVIDRKQLEALAKKNAARQITQKAVKRRKYDDTLQAEPENAEDPKSFFEEMKKREF